VAGISKLAVIPMETDTSKLENELIELDRLNKILIDTAKKSFETFGIYTFDLYCSAIVNRTLNLSQGFANLIRNNNFIAAAPLVRINLDSLLRLFAAFQVDHNIDTFAHNVIKGQAIDKTKDKDGKMMKDSYLVDLLSSKKGYGWVKKIYKTGNEYVHFTSQHIFASLKVDKSKNKITVKGIAQFGDLYIDYNEKLWATKAMAQITKGIIDILNFWTKYKGTLEKN